MRALLQRYRSRVRTNRFFTQELQREQLLSRFASSSAPKLVEFWGIIRAPGGADMRSISVDEGMNTTEDSLPSRAGLPPPYAAVICSHASRIA